MKRTMALAAVATLIFSLAPAAQAGGPGWWPYWGGIYGSGVRGLPPYFSLYPPVYYSYPVPRTYGYSPFAYPPGTPTPDVLVEAPQPKLMINPYVPQPRPAASEEKTAGGPQTIVNPFVPRGPELVRTGS